MSTRSSSGMFRIVVAMAGECYGVCVNGMGQPRVNVAESSSY